MKVRERFHTVIAGLLAYPDGGFRLRLSRCRELCADPQAAAHLADFDAATRGLDLSGLEELYTRTFDFSPSCALEIGWHLFGEDYHRGALLVRLREELARHGIHESCELPDHLTHVLPLVDRMEPDEAARFVSACVTPAVSKLLAGLEGQQNPYECLFRCLVAILDAESGDGEFGAVALPAQEETETRWPCHDSQEPDHEPDSI